MISLGQLITALLFSEVVVDFFYPAIVVIVVLLLAACLLATYGLILAIRGSNSARGHKFCFAFTVNALISVCCLSIIIINLIDLFIF